MLLTKLQGNLSTGSGEEYFRRVFTIYGRGGHPGHVTSIMSTNFHFLVLESLHTEFWFKTTQWFLKKVCLIFICKDLGRRSRNDFNLHMFIYKYTFINSISCLYLLTLRSQAAIVYEKSTVLTFSYRKAQISKFDLAVK